MREVIWIRNMATDSQIEEMLAQRDRLLAEKRAIVTQLRAWRQSKNAANQTLGYLCDICDIVGE